jgi:hypothetical protein
VSHYYASPINQFLRLVYNSGSVPTGSYSLGLPWGTSYDGLNCTAAMGALLIDAHTNGRHKTTPPAIRSHQHDFTGGIGWDDVNVALWDLFGVRLTIPYQYDWADVILALREGRYVGIQGDYDQVPYSYQCQKGGTFDHAFALGDYRASDGRVLLYDPLCRNAAWVPQSTIRGAAEKLALAQRGTKSRLFVMTTAVVSSTTPTVRYRVEVPASRFWRFYTSGTSIVSPFRKAYETGGFSATCSAPARYYDVLDRLPADSYPLVRLLSGSRAGWYIDAKYARPV